MQLTVYHETIYRYSTPVSHSIQVLRLTPRSEPHQRVLRWNIQAPKRLWTGDDAFGNRAHTLVLSEPHGEIRVVAEGVVEVVAPREPGRLPPTNERLSPLAFLPHTRLTRPTPVLVDFAVAHLSAVADSLDDLMGLGKGIADTVAYTPGITDTLTTAAEALEQRRGVCQDHTHLFIACCRIRGVPARYVSGYVDDAGDANQTASHAWADAWLPALGWVSVDVTNCSLVTDHHLRLAVGRDFDSASPVRGVRTGGGNESMDVTVRLNHDQ